MIRKDKSVFGFTVFAFLVFILIFTIENINHRFWLTDFKVYYQAAKTMIMGGRIYFIQFDYGAGLYKYSPFVLFFFLPFCIFSYKVAAILYFVILCFVVWFTFILLRKMLDRYFFTDRIKNEGLLLSFALICIMLHVVKELHLGNFNAVLLLLCCLSLWNCLRNRNILGGILFGIVVLTKPYFLILILPLLFRKNWKALAGMVFTLVVGFWLPLFFLGPANGWELHLEWFKTMFLHQDIYPGVNTVYYFIQHFIYPGLPGFFQLVIIILSGFVAIWLIIRNTHLEKKSNNPIKMANMDFIMEWFILIAVIPNLVKTDSEHFLVCAPLITFIIYSINQRKLYWFIPIFIFLIFLYGGNSTDLFGRELSDKLFWMGLIGLSNLLLLMVALIFHFDLRRKEMLG
ncbi:MAG: glycosyltransferase family 87 protein [Bacteroidetes bacterium]|nr:glycosyltransferase family 87 protein [Bacteroidota bacterium]